MPWHVRENKCVQVHSGWDTAYKTKVRLCSAGIYLFLLFHPTEDVCKLVAIETYENKKRGTDMGSLVLKEVKGDHYMKFKRLGKTIV